MVAPVDLKMDTLGLILQDFNLGRCRYDKWGHLFQDEDGTLVSDVHPRELVLLEGWSIEGQEGEMILTNKGSSRPKGPYLVTIRRPDGSRW